MVSLLSPLPDTRAGRGIGVCVLPSARHVAIAGGADDIGQVGGRVASLLRGDCLIMRPGFCVSVVVLPVELWARTFQPADSLKSCVKLALAKTDAGPLPRWVCK